MEFLQKMAPTGNKKNLFPRGGTVVSKSQKDKKMMKKVRKQVGKKPDLFAEKKKIRSMPKVKSKKNVDLPQAAKDAEIMSGNVSECFNIEIFSIYLIHICIIFIYIYILRGRN